MQHIAVLAASRRRGIGSALVSHVFDRFNLDELVAETDADAVGFYERRGFAVHSLGEKYPGVERFRCTFHRG